MKRKQKHIETLVLGDKRKALLVRVEDLVDDLIYSIDVDADYQREEVWSKKNQEKLLDSIIKGIDIPKLYLFELKKDKQFSYECIDGKQRMLTLFHFFHPSSKQEEDDHLTVDVSGRKYTYTKLKTELPGEAKKIRDYKLEFVVYRQADDLSDEFIREIFQRLQLGVRLNSGELLNAHTGVIRDFIFKDKKRSMPFLRNTNLSDKRYSRQFTLAQICINSFHRARTEDFTRARLVDLEAFFANDFSDTQSNLKRIEKVLNVMDKKFSADNAANISSRAVAVSAYLFCEELYNKQKIQQISEFANFYTKLLKEIKENLQLLSEYKMPRNKTIIDEFQKYIMQASVEPYSLRRRNEFLHKAFAYYKNHKTKGQILGK